MKGIDEKSILTIGCSYKNPKGGIAQVLFNYEQYIFDDFQCIVNSKAGSKLYKLYIACSSLLKFICILIFNRRIKIVHIHTASYISFKRSSYFIRVSRLFRKKTMIHIHGGGFKEYYKTDPIFISKILNQCNCIITLSEQWKDFFENITNKPLVKIVHNIVPLPEIKNVPVDKKVHFLFLGLICKEKGIFDLLKVIQLHKDELKGLIQLHVGGNGNVYELNEYINQHSLQNMVTFEGWVAGNKKTDLLNQADVFILPSYTEGLPVSILEAMSYGLPILSTPVGGIPKVVINNHNGLLFKPGDLDGIYEAIYQILQKKENRSKMGKESRTLVRTYYPENIKKELLNIYQTIYKEQQ